MPLYNNLLRKINEEAPKDEDKKHYQFWEGVEQSPVGQAVNWLNKPHPETPIEQKQLYRSGEKGKVLQGLQYLNDTLGVVDTVVGAPVRALGWTFNTAMEGLSDATGYDKRTLNTALTIAGLSKAKVIPKGSPLHKSVYSAGQTAKYNVSKNVNRIKTDIGKVKDQFQYATGQKLRPMHKKPNRYTDIAEIIDGPRSLIARAKKIHEHHAGAISFAESMRRARELPARSGSEYWYQDSELGLKKGSITDPNRNDTNKLIFSTGVDPVDPKQLDFFETESAISKNLPEFITYPMARDMPAYSKEVPDGYFDYHKMRNWFYASESKGRKALEAGMTPVVPGTQISRGISFSGLAKAQLPKLRKNFAPILKALKIDVAESASIHHIAALKATYGILHKVQVDSPLFRKVYDALLEHIPGLGNMEGNLVPVIGMTKGKKQVSTPHNIVHRFYANTIGESGEKFFTPEVLQGMAASESYRIEKAHELGRIIARSEKIVKDAQQIWRISFSQEKINFNEIVNRLSELDELGYSKLADIEYQTPALSEMIIDVVRDIKVEKDQLERLASKSEDFSDVGKANVLKEARLEEERQRLERIRRNKSKNKPQKGQTQFKFLDTMTFY